MKQDFYADGRAALAFLEAHRVGEDKIVLIGNSLGSGVATQMAMEIRPAALVLISAFTALPDVAASHYPWLPARLRSAIATTTRKIGRVEAPVLILHGEKDQIVPFDNAGKLKSAARNAKLIPFADAGHELAYSPVAQEAVCDWLKRNGN